MDMENVFWRWKMSADDMFILRRWIQYRTIFFFVKKQYPPFAIFFNNYKMVAQKLSIPMTYTPPVPWSLNCLPA